MPAEWPASRFVEGQSWWIASQMVRRHPELTIIETRPEFTVQDNLAFVNSVAAPSSRGAARVLSTTMNDRRPLRVRSGYIQTFRLGYGCWPELRDFPGVAAALEDVRPDDVDGQPGYRFWILVHDHRLVAVVDTDACLCLADGSSTDVFKRFRRTGSLTRTLSDALGQFRG